MSLILDFETARSARRGPVLTPAERAFYPAIGALRADLDRLRDQAGAVLCPRTDPVAATLRLERALDAIADARARLATIEELLICPPTREASEGEVRPKGG